MKFSRLLDLTWGTLKASLSLLMLAVSLPCQTSCHLGLLMLPMRLIPEILCPSAPSTTGLPVCLLRHCILWPLWFFMAFVVFMVASFWRLCPSFMSMLGVAYTSEADCHYAVSVQQQSPCQNCKVWWNWTTLFSDYLSCRDGPKNERPSTDFHHREISH